MLYERLLRPALFRATADDPERAHEWVMEWLAGASHMPLTLAPLAGALTVHGSRLRQKLLGLTFPNPVGLAAGFDKNAVALRALAALGFGFIEAGTVTYHAQAGNERPRLLRLPAERALVNRMGFNNDGAAVVARRLGRTGRLTVPLGVSLGKSRVTPLADATEDYLASLRLLEPFADYIAVNVSSPNTPGLRSLQQRSQVDALLGALLAEAAALAERRGDAPKPVLVKVAPDLADAALDELLEAALARGVSGVIAVNTTVQHTAGFEGGLSGAPLRERALAIVRHIYQRTEGRLPIVGVGGIFSAADAYAMIRAGASLVQVYTGFIYEGPAIARRINDGLLQRMARAGVRSIAELRGTEERQA